MNGWFVNILPPLKFPSLPCSHAPSLSRSFLLHSFPPSPLSLAPSMPRSVLSSLVPFINPPHLPSLYFPAPRYPPASCRATQYTPCVYSVGELHWVLCREGPARRRYAARRGTETMEWSRHQQVARCYLGNAPHDESVFDE